MTPSIVSFHHYLKTNRFLPRTMDARARDRLPVGKILLLTQLDIQQRLEFQRITALQTQVSLRLSWGSVHGSYCSNIEVVGQSWALLCAPIMCMQSGGQPKVNLRCQDLRWNTRTQNDWKFSPWVQVGLIVGVRRCLLLEFHADLKTNENFAKMYTKNARGKKIQEIIVFRLFYTMGKIFQHVHCNCNCTLCIF